MGEVRPKYMICTVSVYLSTQSACLNKEEMVVFKEKKWFKPKFKEGGPPCLKGLAGTLVCMYILEGD